MMKLVVFASLVAATLAVGFNGDPKTAQIIRSQSEVQPDGSYNYAYETENGISAQENGIGAQSAQGGYQFQSPEGENIQVQYVADENGYHPQGNAIPTSPPIPAAIQRALEWIAAHPQPEEPVRRYQ